MNRKRIAIIGGGMLVLLYILVDFIRAPIRVGLIAELTGDVPAVGRSAKRAAELYVKSINENGGVSIGPFKKRLTLIIKDNQGNLTRTRDAVDDLKRAGAAVIIGPNYSRYATTAAEAAESHHIPLIIPWSADPAVTVTNDHKSRHYVFRIAFTDRGQATVLAKFARNGLHAKNAAVLYHHGNTSLSTQAATFTHEFNARNGIVLLNEGYSPDSYPAILNKIAEIHPDIIFLPAYYDEVPLIVKEARRIGITAPFLGSNGWAQETLFSLCGSLCAGQYVGAHYSSASTTPENTRFIARYAMLYNTLPDDVAALTTDAFSLAIHSIVATGFSPTHDHIRNTIAHTKMYRGVTGLIGYNGTSGDPLKSVIITQTTDSDFMFYRIEDP